VNSSRQMLLPGVNPKEYAFKGLLAENPRPSTLSEAEAFFRKHTDTLIKLKEDHDFLRVVLKETNSDEEEEKHQYTIELPLDDPEEREDRYIDLAAKVHDMWVELEAPKHEQ